MRKKKESHREHVLELVRDGKIKYSEKYIKKAPEHTLERILKEYDRKQLDEANIKLTEILIQKFSELMSFFETVQDGSTMEKELSENELFKDDVKKSLSYITPYVPFIGLLSGAVTVGKHVLKGKTSAPEEEQ